MLKFSPVTQQNFDKKNWKHPGNYSYAAQTHLIPVVAGELLKAASYLPLAFLPVEGEWQLVAVMSLIPGTNLLVGPAGQWLGGYVPAMLRSYPFAMAPSPDRQGFNLVAVAEGDHLVPEGSGVPFFDAAGEASPETQQAMNFLVEIEKSKNQMLRACKALAVESLLTPWELVNNNNGEMQKIDGLYRLDQQAFDRLDARAVVKIKDEGGLPIAFAQLYSIEHFDNLRKATIENERLKALKSSAVN